MVNGKWREGETAPTHGGWFQGRLDKTRMSGDAPAVEMTKMSDIFIFTPKFLKLQNIYIWTAYLLLYNLCPIKTHQRTHWVKLSLSLTVGHKTRGISPRCDPIYDPRIGPGIQLQSPTTFPSMSVSHLLITLFLATLTDSLELGEHCDFADLCSLGTRNNSICAVGQKFLIRVCDTYSFWESYMSLQGVRGVRRQFLVSNSSSLPGRERGTLVLFLTRGVKVTECTQVKDITSRLACKVGLLVHNVKVALRKCLAWARWFWHEAQEGHLQEGSQKGPKKGKAWRGVIASSSVSANYPSVRMGRSFLCRLLIMNTFSAS